MQVYYDLLLKHTEEILPYIYTVRVITPGLRAWVGVGWGMRMGGKALLQGTMGTSDFFFFFPAAPLCRYSGA